MALFLFTRVELMETLLHVCCGPCTIYPLSQLRHSGHKVTGYFFNPNIHPYREFRRRLKSLENLADTSQLHLKLDRDYGLTEFLRQIVFHESNRCEICYDIRLSKTVEYAKENGYEAFSTTLLYSKFQNHNLIKEKCTELAGHFSIQFLYDDFRVGWQKGIDTSLELDLYRQPYCGCIYSEQERYDNRLKKHLRKKRKLERKGHI